MFLRIDIAGLLNPPDAIDAQLDFRFQPAPNGTSGLNNRMLRASEIAVASSLNQRA
jgi:hypothetical protein